MQEPFDLFGFQLNEQIYQYSDSSNDGLFQNNNQNIDAISEQDNALILNQIESPPPQKEDIDVVRILNFEEVKVFIDELICPICSYILIDPRICSDCSQGFCKQCLTQWFNKYHLKSCPCCRSISNEPDDGSKAPKLLFKLLSKLKISCKYQNNGCKQAIWYESKEKHYEKECEYKAIICQYCFEIFLKMESETHFEKCQYKPKKCKWCSKSFSYYKHQKHQDDCSPRKLTCPICVQEFSIKKMEGHIQFCFPKKQLKIIKNELQESIQEVQKAKQEIKESIKEILEIDMFIRKQKQKCQKKKQLDEILNNEIINSFEQPVCQQKDVDPQELNQEQVDFQEHHLQQQIKDASIQIQEFGEEQKINNICQEEAEFQN
ncbi:unnamed protein product (macronuclear) [Paramecium tetraurelia]|uniref:RING-type domain-containing protein n=1 Tax=Paramecium tetraurelia TaxID=5888 RepID=A0CU32_PARTE|nr:uncharacterized protein GSPATT00010498001 [Paramecium tetraurelia]CAK74299.1 unnamed protein product [Paramecium tetraurelia]|eukprot:XP_001441696.1 hypothetical protein (macronuclear) [Paramecium tetraurelia strain d4-2]